MIISEPQSAAMFTGPQRVRKVSNIPLVTGSMTGDTVLYGITMSTSTTSTCIFLSTVDTLTLVALAIACLQFVITSN